MESLVTSSVFGEVIVGPKCVKECQSRSVVKTIRMIFECPVESIKLGESAGHRLRSTLGLRESSAGRCGLFPHPGKVVLSKCFAEFGQSVADLSVVGDAIGLEILFSQFLFQLSRCVVSSHFVFILGWLAQPLPSLCELVAASCVVWVFGENSLQRSDDRCGLFFIDGHVDL